MRRTAASSSADHDDAARTCTGGATRRAAAGRTCATRRTAVDVRCTGGLALARRAVSGGRIVAAGRVRGATGGRVTMPEATGRGPVAAAYAALAVEDVPGRTRSHIAAARTVTF